MKNNHTYVPILKYREAEILSLRDLNQQQKDDIVPLLQLVHHYKNEYTKDEEGNKIAVRRELSPNEVLKKALDDIRKYINDTRLFLDVSILFPTSKDYAWTQIAESLMTLFGNKVVIVMTPEDVVTQTLSQTVKDCVSQKGIALRVNKAILSENFWETVDENLSRMGLERKNVDLILDYQLPDDEMVAHAIQQLQNKNNTVNWRSVTIASGAFVENLMGYEPGNHDLKRVDWSAWNQILSAPEVSDLTNLGYGDYTIQYPLYTPPPARMNASRSVRYAKEDKWVIIKGLTDTAKNSAKTKQYYAHAQVLVGEGISCGENCCWGDKLIHEINNKVHQKYGNSSTWVRVGITHHISLTIKQLASFGQSSD